MQFIATPVGSGHSVEAQVTGSDSKAGIQIEITPLKLKKPVQLFVKPDTGKTITVAFPTNLTVDHLKTKIAEMLGIEHHKQRLVCFGRTLSDGKTMFLFTSGFC